MHWHQTAIAVALMGTLFACGEPEAPAPPPAAPAPPAAAAPAEPPRPDLLVPPPLLPRGLIRNDPSATPGYVLFHPSLSDTAYLVDNEGRVVHLWKTPYAPGGDLELLAEREPAARRARSRDARLQDGRHRRDPPGARVGRQRGLGVEALRRGADASPRRDGAAERERARCSRGR